MLELAQGTQGIRYAFEDLIENILVGGFCILEARWFARWYVPFQISLVVNLLTPSLVKPDVVVEPRISLRY